MTLYVSQVWVNSLEPDFSKFWIRGLSVRCQRIGRLQSLSPEERLFAAVLRSDASESSRLMEPDTNREFLELVKLTRCARFVLDTMCQIDVVKLLQKDIHSALNQLAVKETVDQKRVDKDFADVLNILRSINIDLVWIKGAALSRSVYDEPYHRQFGDLDVVVRSTSFDKLIELLTESGFFSVIDPGFCNQALVGPVVPPSSLALTPAPDLVPTSVASMQRIGTMVDIKIGPLDTGVQVRDINRFFNEAEQFSVLGANFLAPSVVDHLMICLYTYFKDRCVSWKTLLDIHRLTLELNKDSDLWDVLVERCNEESIGLVAWMGLSVSSDRLGSLIPNKVLKSFAPRTPTSNLFDFCCSPFFVWNATSFPMMLVNLVVSSNRKRKLEQLRIAAVPSNDFLSSYYNNGKPMSATRHALCQILHLLVLVLPGGAVRRSFGWWLWPVPEFTIDEKKTNAVTSSC